MDKTIRSKTTTTYPDGRVVEVVEYEQPKPPDPLAPFRDYMPKVPLPMLPTWPHKDIRSGYLRGVGGSPCLFDGLPDGAYGISCPCPKCTPQC